MAESGSTQFSCLACQCIGFQRVLRSLSQVSCTGVRVYGAGDGAGAGDDAKIVFLPKFPYRDQETFDT
jgi:hypothetical protein